jgi:hypothetical protein
MLGIKLEKQETSLYTVTLTQICAFECETRRALSVFAEFSIVRGLVRSSDRKGNVEAAVARFDR